MSPWELEQIRVIVREELERHRAMREVVGLDGLLELDRRLRVEAEIEKRREDWACRQPGFPVTSSTEEWR